MTPRQMAKSHGLKMYFTAKPCKSGHVVARYVASGSCSKCCEAWNNDIRHRSQCRQWREDNKLRVRELNDRWAARRLETTRRWREQNPEAVSLSWRTDGARRRGADGSHTSADIRSILQAQRQRCAYCKKRVGDNFHVDHVIAIARGGTNRRSNLQILCPPCNLKKHARDPMEFARSVFGMLL